MKYLQLIHNDVRQVAKWIMQTPCGSGSYNWVPVFEGALANYDYQSKEDLEKYDVVHINAVPASFAMIVDVAKKLQKSSTILCVNNDYLPEVWNEWDLDPLLYHNIQKLADCTFGTEPIQTSQMIEGSHCIPHPTDTKTIKMFRPKGDSNVINVVYNQYDKNLYHTSLMTKRLKDEFGLRAKMTNYGKQHRLHGYHQHYFDRMVGFIPFQEWLMEITSSKIGYMPHIYHGYNRAGVEFACTGVPVVGSDRSYSLQICYPETICNPLDFNKTKELFKKLINDNDFREKVSKQARENSEFFNYENSKKRFMTMIEGVKK